MNTRIKTLRKNLGLTQPEFASKLNLSGNYVFLIEKGERNPSDRTISDICRIFDVNEEWLRTGEGEMFNPEPTDKLDALFGEYGCDDFDRNLIKEYLALNPEQRNVLKEYVSKVFQGGQTAEKEKS